MTLITRPTLTIAIIILTLIALAISFPLDTLKLIRRLKRRQYRRAAQRYGHCLARRRVPLQPWEINPWERHCADSLPTLEQCYAYAWPLFLGRSLGLRPLPSQPKLTRWQCLRVALTGFLIDRGWANIVSAQDPDGSEKRG
jgi:hypothetical protein